MTHLVRIWLKLIALWVFAVCGFLTAQMYFFPPPQLLPDQLRVVTGTLADARLTTGPRIQTSLQIRVDGYNYPFKTFERGKRPLRDCTDHLLPGSRIELLVRETEFHQPINPLLGHSYIPLYAMTVDGNPLLTLEDFNASRSRNNFWGKFASPAMLLFSLFFAFVAFAPVPKKPGRQQKRHRRQQKKERVEA